MAPHASRTAAAKAPPSLCARGLASAAAWALLVLGSPGFLTRDGLWPLVPLGLGLWGAFAARPLGEHRRRALVVEALIAGVGYTALMWWVAYVVPLALVYFVLGYAVYFGCTGALARALRSVLPLGLACAIAWTSVEVVRDLLPPPFGLGWLRLGHALNAQAWIAPSARVFGVEGLGFVVACAGGLLAELLVARCVARATLVVTAAALLTALGLARLGRGVGTESGPRVLLVQPALEQQVKQFDSAEDVYRRVHEETLAAVHAARERGEDIDLVCWGETMLPLLVLDPAVGPAYGRGLRPPPWFGPFSAEDVIQWARLERRIVAEEILHDLPPGTSFLSGVEVLDVVGEELRRRNANLLWNPDGSRAGMAAKRFLVPGAETMLGLERFDVVRAVVEALVSYVPDFAPAERTGVLALATRDGRRFRFGASVCFDNAFLEPYVEPLLASSAPGAGGLDFHLVTSNEAWYHESCELDQMVAFSRLIALSTGRAIVRATNSGVTLVLGPEGEEVGRLTREGRDRSVAGSLLVTVPVPRDRSVPLYPRTRDLWRGLLVLGALVPLAARAFSGRRGAGRAG
jgi:apolipoprotein N-acyltransferase